MFKKWYIEVKRYLLEFKGTVSLGKAMKLNRRALEKGLMDYPTYLRTRDIYKQQFNALLEQTMPKNEESL